MPTPVSFPISKEFDKATVEELTRYVHDQTGNLIQQWKELRETKITAWRRIYRGVPKEKYKSFPWKNAANLVPQIAGSYVDQLTARCVMGIYGIDPLFPVALIGDYDTMTEAEQQRAAAEEWMTYAGKSPEELNLYLAEYVWIKNAIKYGLCAMKTPWEVKIEHVAESQLEGSIVFKETELYDGPKPQPILFENFMMPLTKWDLQHSNMVCHVVTLSEFDLKSRAAMKIYPQKMVDDILASPDRDGPTQAGQAIEQDVAGYSTSGRPGKEYDIYECYFPYLHNSKRFQIIASYHRRSRTMARAVFNFYPDNMLPFRLARMGMDGESCLGLGFCQMLGVYQEEISQIHNQRRDAGTAANTNVLRVGRGSPIDTNFAVYPMAIIPAEQGDLEILPLGRPATETIKDEQQTLALATDRAGVGPSSSGSGSGSPNRKGVYSAQGTFATMQEGNTRANLNLTDMRYAHLSLGSDLLKMYAYFGISDKKLKGLGKMGPHLSKALESVRSGNLTVPVRAATGSVNKEVEKQNKMLMAQHLTQQWQMVQGVLAQQQNPMLPPNVKRYNLEMLQASQNLWSAILKDFGFDDPSQMLPDPHVKEQLTQMEQQGKQQQGQQQQLPQGMPPVAQMAPGINPEAIQQMARQDAQ